MKSQYWIVPSIAAALCGVGYGVVGTMDGKPAAVSAVPSGPKPADAVPTAVADDTTTTKDDHKKLSLAYRDKTPADRVTLSYRRKGDDDFAEVKVATVEPFRGSVAVDERIAAAVAEDGVAKATPAGETALAPASLAGPGGNGASAFLKQVAAAGDAAARASAPAFESTPLSRRLLDNDQPQWQSRFFADNPLVGGIFQGDGNRSDASQLMGAAKAARYVLLGESHDNPDHHRLQSDIVGDLADGQSDLSMVFEMIPHRLGSVVSAFGTTKGRSIDLDDLPERLEWSERGWPEFSMYRPLFEAAKREGIAVSPGDLDRELVSSIASEGIAGLSAETRARLSLEGEADPALAADLMDEIRLAHCGLMPDGAIAPMATVQRARDGSLAASMTDAAKDGDQAVLIAGAGHVRNDRGVPALLNRRDPEGGTVSVRMMEVDGEDDAPADYGLRTEEPAPYDFTIFTPRASIEDPCEGLRARMKDKSGATAGE
ncbi:hypothetical protein E3C22_18390 [Jiella endophytica]|uniref:Haem-binding uptake Tiki superfamily ChaN domain-containing protein n=1 Tax=Jiella endophytica TaxID=2558362 RepID=A0A4Y8RCW9_9HYPH|nr:ChaN family lipoprotein [Jiella endophytica]TFF19667.1 hypothetical protein E3C22_18390 [Jiella endophytica]